VSRIAQHSISTPGQLRRVAISALVDGVKDDVMLHDIEQVLAAAVGMDASRGDVVRVTGMPFNRSHFDDEALAMEEARRRELYWTAGKVAAFVILIVIALIYLRSILNTLSPSRKWMVEKPEPRRLAKGEQRALPSGTEDLLDIDDETARQLLAELVRRGLPVETADGAAVSGIRTPRGLANSNAGGAEGMAPDDADELRAMMAGVGAASTPVPTTHEANERIAGKVSAMARMDPKQIAQVIKDWMVEKE
jgi:flagellar biosynthesis/type III secretory pathway M-ring protein FliF/YscJ